MNMEPKSLDEVTRELGERYLLSRSGTPGSPTDVLEVALQLLDAHIHHSGGAPFKPAAPSHEGVIIRLPEVSHWHSIDVRILALESETVEPEPVLDSIQKEGEGCLSFVVLPSDKLAKWDDSASRLRNRGITIISVYPKDLRALAENLWTVDGLADFKLYRTYLGKADSESQYDDEVAKFLAGVETPSLQNLESALKERGEHADSWAEHPRLQELVEELTEGNDCLLIGPSSSGKTVLAFQAGFRLSRNNFATVVYTNVGSLGTSTASRFFTCLINGMPEKQVVLLDDLQASPVASQYLLSTIGFVGRIQKRATIRVLGITWEGYAKELSQTMPKVKKIEVAPLDAQNAISAKYQRSFSSDEITQRMRTIAGEDVLLWRLLCELGTRRQYSRPELAELLWRNRIEHYERAGGDLQKAKRAMFVASTLGRYDFYIPKNFLLELTRISEEDLQRIIQGGVLRQIGDLKITAGHASACSLLSDWLLGSQHDLDDLGEGREPAKLVASYINHLDSQEKWNVVKKLASQVGFRDVGLSDRAQVLAEAWKAIDALIDRVERQQAVGANWNNSLSNSLFAVESLSLAGKRESVTETIDFMRSHWSLQGNRITVLPGTTERKDFDGIKTEMRLEDDDSGSKFNNYESIDFDRFHDTWVTGLILCAEAAYRGRSSEDREELNRLANAVEEELDPLGFFYPSRVPWCTARVLMGLAKCGKSYTSSAVMRTACEWLLTPKAKGGPFWGSMWKSGTGDWNSTLETTAMCVIALAMAGVPDFAKRLAPSMEFIVSEKWKWSEPDREMDGVNAIHAYVKYYGSWTEITKEVKHMLNWASRMWSAPADGSEGKLKQSCEAAQITDYLVEDAWFLLERDLESLLRAFALPKFGQMAEPDISAPIVKPPNRDNEKESAESLPKREREPESIRAYFLDALAAEYISANSTAYVINEPFNIVVFADQTHYKKNDPMALCNYYENDVRLYDVKAFAEQVRKTTKIKKGIKVAMMLCQHGIVDSAQREVGNFNAEPKTIEYIVVKDVESANQALDFLRATRRQLGSGPPDDLS